MEGIDKLRELAADINSTEIIAHIDTGSRFAINTEWLGSWRKAFDAACDAIEAEIAERYMESPVDADGVPIRIGDVMENLREDLEPQLHHTFRVYGILYRDYGQKCALTENGYPTILYRASECRHYHAPTVEEVLREFGDWYAHTKGGCDEDGIIAEYAAKLRLAGDAG